MSGHGYTFGEFPIDERGAAEALGIDYGGFLAHRKLVDEERTGFHGPQRRELREAIDDLERRTQRRMFGP